MHRAQSIVKKIYVLKIRENIIMLHGSGRSAMTHEPAAPSVLAGNVGNRCFPFGDCVS